MRRDGQKPVLSGSHGLDERQSGAVIGFHKMKMPVRLHVCVAKGLLALTHGLELNAPLH